MIVFSSLLAHIADETRLTCSYRALQLGNEAGAVTGCREHGRDRTGLNCSEEHTGGIAMAHRENTRFSGTMWKVPATFTPLLGREREVAAIGAFLTQTQTRLLTLTGAPGIGKTRLSLEVAQSLRSCFVDGVCFVELAALPDPGLVVPTLASVLGIRENEPEPLAEQLKRALRDKHLLLLLDNFEHLLPAASEVGELLAVCPTLKIVVTSRNALRVQAEYLFPVAPLALPDLSRLPEHEVLARTAAVALFVQRAQAIRPDFQLTAANARAIAEICVRLDGLPLAIELAAARVNVLSPQELLARLSSRLGLLTRGAWTLPERHQTLRKAIGWSYDLLPAEEQLLFRCLSVFAGGCQLSAVEAVWATLGEDHEAGQILDSLASLIDKSLLQRTEHEGDEPRLVMLETIREYALEQLAVHGEMEDTQQAHADYYLRLAEETEPHLWRAEQTRWLDRLEREHDNLRAALHWTLEQGAVSQRLEIALRLGGALWRFWQVRGHVSERHQWLEKALAAGHAGVAPARAKALYAAGMLTMDQGDYQQTVQFCEASLALYRELEEQRGMAVSLNALGYVAHRRGENATSRTLLEEGLTMARAIGDREGIAQSLFFLAREAGVRGKYVAARSMFEESLAIYREIGDISHMAQVLVFLANVVLDQGEHAMAQSLAEEGLALCRGLGNFLGLTYRQGLRTLHEIAFYQSDYTLACSTLEEALAIARKQGAREEIAHGLARLGAVALYQGDYVAARSLLEEGITISREVGNQRHVAFALGDLGRVFLYQGDFVKARTYLEEDVAIASGLGDQRALSYALGFLGQLALYQGGWPTARSLMEESLAIHRETGLYEEGLTIFLALQSKWFIAASFEGLAAAVLAQGQPTWATRLWGAAEPLRTTLGTPLPPVERPAYERSVAAARTQLGEQAFAAAWAEGRTMTPEQVLAAQEPASMPEPVSTAKPPPATPYPNDLTPREVEVLRRVAAGSSNQEIADRLVISERTVNSHLVHIFNKLGVNSRAAAAAFAIRQKLAQ